MNYPERRDLHQGKFSDGDPVAGIAASVISAEQINALYDEMIAAIIAGGITPDVNDVTQLATVMRKQQRLKQTFEVSGDANQIVLNSLESYPKVTELRDYDEFSFIVPATNTGVVSIKIDDFDFIPLENVVADTQIFATALLTVRYIAGAFYIAEQINPKTGNPVALIGELLTSVFAHTGACKMRFNGAELNRADHPILFAKAQKAGLVEQTTKDANLTGYGARWGSGDGSTTFTVPIFDGAFVRFADHGRGLDSGRELGSWQGDAFQGHRHAVRADILNRSGVGAKNFGTDNDQAWTGRDIVGEPTSDGVNGGPRVANETRPKNYALNAEFLI